MRKAARWGIGTTPYKLHQRTKRRRVNKAAKQARKRNRGSKLR